MAHWNEPDPLRTFDGRAVLYERGRPGYPAEALDWLLEGLGEPAELSVADVGAGSGRLARLLVERACRTVAIEPNADMRAAAPPTPGLSWRPTTGEATGLADDSVDLVTVAQAFHWLEPERALPELRRVLRPRGRLALLWNDRRRERPFELAYHELLRELKPADRRDAPPRVASDALSGTAWFEEPDCRRFPLVHEMNLETLIARTASLSYAPRDESGRAALEERLTGLHAEHADAAGLVHQGYSTTVHRATART